ncbi:WXG100 family type VII secretion target [Actinoplanes philippinensis]|uniref:WXG100 family type VII secretion target n=1 Tax=Actinoplanes philippinensis TaxID=35752 RepID=UPI0033D713C8
MPEEIVGGYAAQTHDELYRAVMAGDPDQVDDVATVWRSLQGTVEQIGAALATDLGALQQMWQGEAGAEFQRRAGLIAGYCADLGRDFDALHQGLTLMAGALREARAEAEEPATLTTDPVAMVADTATIGAAFGAQPERQEAAKSRERMVRLVTDLALTYTLTGADRWPGEVPQPPPDLPGAAPAVASGAAAGGASATAAPSTSTPGGTSLASGGGLSASSVPSSGLFAVRRRPAPPA